ncbi:VWA domain-containing protein [Acinetobacter pseudolwoffii]|uniref:vWA domain-containing protein n=1 Tax=Acinetobacter pseudolwoffii TaxID=2053287 RepID=UPI001CE05C17|nr:VWA domain-containing protein [Acinetobacter pseudolwoffii]UBX53395.1 VWA domain-containing protein [Acinetobacter pseudolwoffii]
MTKFNPANFTVAKAKPLPVILLLDVSGSMGGESIKQLNIAVKEMISDFASAEKNEVEILVSIITFGSEVLLHTPYTSAKDIDWKDLTVSGSTPMGTAFSMAKAMIEDKETTPSRAYRPTIVLVSDGEPTDSWEQPLRALVNDGRSNKCDRMAMAIGGAASNSVLNEFISGTENKVFTAADASQIQEFFKFVTMSVTTRTNSQNANVVPKPEEIEQLVKQEQAQQQEESDEFI